MHKKLIPLIGTVSALVLITVYLGVTPVWSAPSDKKPEIQKPAKKGAIKPSNLEDGVEGKDSVKKKAVKKAGTAAAIGVAGTAAAIGVAGTKVQSGVKGKVTKDKE